MIYSTCFVNFNKKNTGVAALKVLKKNGVEVQEAYPGCCGMPFLEQADLPKVVEQAKKVSKDLIEWIDKGYKVITLTASCGLMLKFEWPLLLPNDENIKKLSANVMDIDEFVVDISNNEGLVDGLQEIDGGVTVHHACHARAQNMGIKARDMLKLIPNIKIDVVERCAGHGGTFGVMKETHDLAIKVGRPTARQIKTKNNKYMASDCPLAGKHLKQLETDTKISNDEALHPIELVAKVIGYDDAKRKREILKDDIMPLDVYTKKRKELRKVILDFKKIEEYLLGLMQHFILKVLRQCWLKFTKCCILKKVEMSS